MKTAQPLHAATSSASFSSMPIGDAAADAAADGLQAQYMRRCLSNERADLAGRLGKHARLLNESITSGQTRNTGHLRGHVRRLENEIREINRMLDALARRFPDRQAGSKA